MSTLTIDIETDGLVNPNNLWCMVTQNVDTGEVKRYVDTRYSGGALLPNEQLLIDLDGTETLVGHNIIGYDHPVLRYLLVGYNHCRTRIIDTLILANLYHYNARGGHSLAQWGERLGHAKIEHSEWDHYSPEMLARCTQDVKITTKLYKLLLKKLNGKGFDNAIKLEHQMQWLLQDMQDNGFPFDIHGANALHNHLLKEKDKLDVQLQEAFKPKTALVREVTPKTTKHGTLHRGDFRWMREDQPDLTPFSEGCKFSVIKWVPFNPGSSKQRIEKLWEHGWKPIDKTKGYAKLLYGLNDKRRRGQSFTKEEFDKLEHYKTYGWQTSKTNLSTIPDEAPQAIHLLKNWLLVSSRCSTLVSWMENYNTQTQCIHGKCTGLGAWTHRAAHAAPNMGNVPAVDNEWGKEMRSLFHATEGWDLVGCDASGIQLRVLAHYLNNPEYSDIVCNGTEEEGNDIHFYHKDVLGPICKERKNAKTFIYAWVLDAGIPTVANILSCSQQEAREAGENFLQKIDGLQELKFGKIPADAQRGYFIGFDGRLVACRSAHLMLAGYLQNGESTIMKLATTRWHHTLREEKIPFLLADWIHDEWQTLTPKPYSKKVGQHQRESLQWAGKRLNLNCPMDGAFKIGNNWSETH
jgi:DNA polymerase-1